MNEPDVMRLLAEANPVRIDSLPAMDATVLDRILAPRRRPDRRLMLAAAVVTAALAASLIGVFAFGGHGSHPNRGATGGPNRLGSNGSWTTIAVSDAAATLGAPVVLPDTDLVKPSDAASKVRAEDCPGDSADTASPCSIYVHFPARSLGIRYTRPVPFPDPSAQWAADVRSAGEHQAQLIDLNGVPAEWLGTKQIVEFVVGGTWIIVSGGYDEATLQSVAQSIVDRTGGQAPAGTVSAGPLQWSPINLDFTRGGAGITSIDVTISAATLGGTALLQVVRGVPDSSESATGSQIVFQEQVQMTNVVPPPSGPPGTVVLSTWSGTLSPSDWEGGCEDTAYVIDVKVSPAVPTREAMGESAESGSFVCSSGS